MIDLHAHLLPGVDDGPPAMTEAVALAAAAAAAGTRAAAATPHVSGRHPTPARRMEAGVTSLRRALAARGVPLVVHRGAEVALEQAVSLDDDELRRLRLGAGPFLLLESPHRPCGDPGPLIEAVQRRGHRVLLAHPERSPGFQADPGQVERLVAGGVLTSVTAGALGGRFGAAAQRLGVALLEAGLVHDLASDAHDLDARPPGLRAALEPALVALDGLEAQLAWLTEAVPRAILAGAPIPAGPAVAVRARAVPRRGRLRLPRLRRSQPAGRARSSSSP